MRRAPPLQWVGAILLAWAGGRAAMLWPAAREMAGRAPAPVRALLGVEPGRPAPLPAGDVAPTRAGPPMVRRDRRQVVAERPPIGATEQPEARTRAGGARRFSDDAHLLAAFEVSRRRRFGGPLALGPGFDAAMAAGEDRRWRGEAYLFLRKTGGGDAALAPGGTLGGGQAFARLSYRLDRAGRWAATGRVSRAVGGGGGEGAIGLRYAPLPTAAVTVERRVALERGGRDAWALVAATGVDAAPIGPLRGDGYVQAGLVGARRRDGFVDGAARIGRPLGPAVVGLGAWGAAQPGLGRLDLGPQAVVRFGGASGFASAALDWRIRVAGDARPGGGVALTLAGSF